MIEKKFINLKKQEFKVKEYIKKNFNYISSVKLERTPIGEKIVIRSARPNLIAGRRGEGIDKISEVLKKRFGLENPQVEIQYINNMLLDAASIAEYIKKALEHFGPLSFKVIAYKTLEMVKSAGALGAEIKLSGKLPSERARRWVFSYGYLSKSGEYREQIVDHAKAQALTKPGIVGIKVSIVKSDATLPDKLEIKTKITEKEIK